jgi:uncharacterized membrane protein YphA (DoxX/SURF4 family)
MRPEKAIIIIRLMVGLVFLSEGIQKFLFADSVGAGRFEKIGIPHPEIMGPFVGTTEIVFGTLVVLGLFTRFVAIPLLCVILTAIATTKIPMLLEKGFWIMAHESRTDFSMLMGLIFILVVGGGSLSLDQKRSRRRV